MEIVLCPECKVPELFGQAHAWLNNGDIVQALNPRLRLGFVECENLDPLFANIGEIIGFPIESLVTEIVARGVESYMREIIPGEVRELVQAKEIDPVQIDKLMLSFNKVMGHGKSELIGVRFERDEDDYTHLRIIRPVSAPVAAGNIAGSLAAITWGKHGVSYREISPGVYDLIASREEVEESQEERLQIPLYTSYDGDLDLERCHTCGVPRDFRDFAWNLDEGIILSKRTGRRMAMLGPEALDHLFDELENELGEAIPEVVVKAQCRFTKSGFYSPDDYADVDEFRTGLALRGLGNLKELDVKRSGLHMRLDNAALRLMIVGIMQGVFEVTFDVDSTVEWELSEEGDLVLEVAPR